MKATAEWLRDTVFRDEAIRPREAPAQREERLPALLRAARSLEGRLAGGCWQSREAIFLKQARLLARYEDDCPHSGPVQRYYPTYQALTDSELRGYFTWRTRLRAGEPEKTALSYVFLYIYELINQVGTEDPMEGYRRLADFKSGYGKLDNRVLPYLSRWMADYVIYYGLDAALLSETGQARLDQSVLTLEHIREREPGEIIRAAEILAPKWLGRSRFRGEHPEELDAVIVRVLRRMAEHYGARCKKSMAEQYFGAPDRYQVRLFDSAVFCDPLKRRNYEYALSESRIYRCENGVWSVWKRGNLAPSNPKLEELMKTIDAVTRRVWEDGHPIQSRLTTKWILRIIEEEARSLLAEQKAAEERKVTIDYTRLTQIRRDAAVTREKLIVEEEEELPPLPPPAGETPAETSGIGSGAFTPPDGAAARLEPAEYRLLRCLLYGGGAGWVREEGLLLSVLADGINEKLYDVFQDSVLDDTPQLVEDYIEDLKEMVRP